MADRPAAPAFNVTRNVRLLYAFSFIGNFQLWFGIWIIYLTDFRGVTLLFVGLLETFFQVVSLTARIPAGAFADRFGRRNSLAAAMLIEGSGLLLFAFAGNYPLLLGSYVLWALGGTLREPANAAYLYDALAVGGREDDFAKLFGRLTAIATGGFLLGTLVGAPVAQATSLQVPVALSVVPYATAFAVALLLSEPPRRRREQRRGYVQTIRESGAVFRRDPAMRYLVLLSVGTAFAAAAQIILLQPFLRAHDVPIAAFGLILTPLRLVSMGGSVSAYLLGRALGLRRVFALLSVGPIVMLLLVAGIDHVSMFLALGAINAFAMLRQPLFIDYMNRRTDADVRVTVLSIRRLGIAVVLAVASPLGGALGERSLQLAFVALAFACAIVVVPAYLLWLRADRAGAAHE